MFVGVCRNLGFEEDEYFRKIRDFKNCRSSLRRYESKSFFVWRAELEVEGMGVNAGSAGLIYKGVRCNGFVYGGQVIVIWISELFTLQMQ